MLFIKETKATHRTAKLDLGPFRLVPGPRFTLNNHFKTGANNPRQYHATIDLDGTGVGVRAEGGALLLVSLLLETGCAIFLFAQMKIKQLKAPMAASALNKQSFDGFQLSVYKARCSTDLCPL